jgi:oxygen-independent coproporphyrinogen-3 oxidase
MAITQLPPLGLYVHIPWCVRKCPYCDFNSHTHDGELPEAAYVAALLADLANEQAHAAGRPLQSIFFGGGTPSLFSPQAIGQIIDAARTRLGFSPDIEITLEANPGTVELARFKGYREAGVNRLSIGVQSFAAQQLQKLGRIHSRDEALRAGEAARAAGFDNFNIDLMHGLENQTVSEAVNDLEQAIALAPSHISWYQLTIEPNTVFYKQPPLIPADDQLADIQDAGETVLAKAGFEQYEVSAYAKAGQRSQHNLNYWRFGDYLGIGAGAHGKYTELASGQIIRNWKSRSPRDYLATGTAFEAGRRNIGNDELTLEFMMNALRLNEGFELDLFQQRTGLSFDDIKSTLGELVNKQLLHHDGERYCCSGLGKRYLNEILAEF